MTADTISNQINRISNNIEMAYSALYDKGATMPATNNSALLADTINTITGGGGSDIVGKYTIDNGIAKVEEGDITGRFNSITGVEANVFRGAFTSMNIHGTVQFPNLTSVNANSFSTSFYNCENITGADFSNLTNIQGMYGFNAAFTYSGIEEANFCNLTTITNYSFYNGFQFCGNLRRANFSSLTTLPMGAFNNAFWNCFNLEYVDFSSLTTLSGSGSIQNAFVRCGTNTTNGLQVNFNSLQTLSSDGYMPFQGAKLYPNLTFPNLTKVSATGFFNYTTGLDTVDFPALTIVDSMQYFFGYSSVRNVYLNNVQTVGNGFGGLYSAFASSNVETVNLENVSNVGATTSGTFGSTFSQCKNLTNIYLPNIHHNPSYRNTFSYCFSGCSNLKTITIGTNAIEYNCCTLQDVNCANMSCFQGAFWGTDIESVNMYTNSRVGNTAFNNAFTNCTNLTSANITINGSNTQAFIQCFNGDIALDTLTLTILSNATIGNNSFTRMVNGCSVLGTATIGFVGDDGANPLPTLQDNAFSYMFTNSGIVDVWLTGSAHSTTSPFRNFVNGCNDINLNLTMFDVITSGDIFGNALEGTDGCTITFSSSSQSTVEGWASYTANFGGTNVTVSFE